METNIVSKLKNDSQEKWRKIIEFKFEFNKEEERFINKVYLGGEFICLGKGKSNKLSKERAAMKACKILKLL